VEDVWFRKGRGDRGSVVEGREGSSTKAGAMEFIRLAKCLSLSIAVRGYEIVDQMREFGISGKGR